MKVLEFGFMILLDLKYRCATQVYSKYSSLCKTHDNEVVNGWYKNLTDEQREYVNSYTNKKDDEPINQAMLKTFFLHQAILPFLSMQDLLNLGEETE